MKKQTFTLEELTPFVQAAEKLGVSTSALRKMEGRGILRFVKRPYGRLRVFIPNEDIERLQQPLSADR